MRIALLLILAMAAQAAWARPPQAPLAVKRAIANDLDLLLGDTVNEGDVQASVRYVRNIPQMSCVMSPSRRDPAVKLIKCEVEFNVIDTTVRPHLPYEVSCFLIYTIRNRDLRAIRRGPERLIDQCLQNLSDPY